MKQRFPGLKINQRDLKIATPQQSFDPDFGFWDIKIGKVSYLGPEKGLCQMLCVISKDNKIFGKSQSSFCHKNT